MKKTFEDILKIIFVAVIFFCAAQADASTMAIVSAMQTVHVGQESFFDVTIDPTGQLINALGGVLVYPAGLINVRSISTVGSVANLWLESPHAVAFNDKGESHIVWSGLLPGGFIGVRSPFYTGVRPGLVFRVFYTPIISGDVYFRFENLDIRLHDGQGTAVSVSSAPFKLSIIKNDGVHYPLVQEDVQASSTVPVFASIIRDPLVSSNQWFVMFNEDTTQVSVDHFEVAETYATSKNLIAPNEWKTISSPYILQDQNRSHYVFIREKLSGGSERLIVVPPLPQKNLFQSFWFWVIIVGVFIFFRWKK